MRIQRRDDSLQRHIYQVSWISDELYTALGTNSWLPHSREDKSLKLGFKDANQIGVHVAILV